MQDWRRYTPESDSGIGSPFGRPPSIFDWMESRQTQENQSTYTSAADTFSMGAVKTEMTSELFILYIYVWLQKLK